MPDPSPSDLMHAALEITEAAESIPLRHFRSDLAVEDKPDESPVTVADRQTEEKIRQEIAVRFPTHNVLGEEFGKSDAQSAFTWIIDPIDGTRSFIGGVPLFGMLLGIVQDGEAVAGVIRMPALGECYAGCRGGSAMLNGKKIRCRRRPVERAFTFINEAKLMVERQPELLKRLMGFGHEARFFNDCYAFALLAAGHVDAVVDFDLQPYDYLPVVPVVEAAGGIITDWQGAPLGLNSDGSVIAAATPEVHAALMRILR